MRVQASVAFLLTITFLTATVHAIQVRHNGNVIAVTGYEDLELGNADSHPDLGQTPTGFGNFDGDGFVNSSTGVRALQIQNSAGTGDTISALDGTQFAHCGSGGDGQCKTGLIFTADPIFSGVLEIEWNLYKPTGSGRVGFALSGDTDISGPFKRAQGEIGFVAIDGIDNEYDVNVRTPGVADANVDINLDEWNHFMLHYDFKSELDFLDDEWTLFVNGNEQTLGPLAGLDSGTPAGIDRFGFESTAADTNWAVDFDIGAVEASDYEWRRNGDSNWNTSLSWTPDGGPPNGDTYTALFGSHQNLTSPTTVTANEAITVNRIDFNNDTNSFAIAGLGSINLAGTTPSVNVASGNHQFQAVVNLEADTTVDSNGNLDFNNQVNTNGNDLNITGSGTVNLNNSVVGGGLVTASGTLGTAGGTSVTANLMLDGATLDVDIGDTSTGQSSDKLSVNGSATLAGDITVNVDVLGGFTPDADVTILTATSPIDLTGSLLPLAGSGAGMFTGVGLSSDGTRLLLFVDGTGNPVGDYNNDGSVDAADYTVYRDNLGADASVLQNNGIAGAISVAHYSQWKDNFGLTAGSGSAAAVPEPASFGLILLSLVVAASIGPRCFSFVPRRVSG